MGKEKIPYVCILGGGAIRGLSYIGALEALQRLNVDIKKIAGSSVGSLFAAFWSVGYTTYELKEIFKDFNFQMFKDINWGLRPKLAISKGEVFYNFLKKCIEKKFYGLKYSDNNKPVTFRDVDMDLFIFTSDLTKCKPQIFSKYTNPDFEIAKAVRISASLPGLMNPVEYNNSVLVDGDLIKSWPLWLVDSNLNPENYRVLEYRLEGGKENGKIKSPLDFANTVISCMSNYATDHLVDLYGKKDKFDYITIDTDDLFMMDLSIPYNRRQKLIDLGYDTTIDYFNNHLPLKKLYLKEIYSQILDVLIKVNNKITLSKYFEAKSNLLELFVSLCDTKHVIDSTIFKKIDKFYSLFSKSTIKLPVVNMYHLRNKNLIINDLNELINILKTKIVELNSFLDEFPKKLA